MSAAARLIVGLGNPGREYEKTRHNVGFVVADAFARRHGIGLNKRDFRSVSGDGRIGEARVFILKPLTFMNDSGVAVSAFLRQKPLPLDNVLVVVDDIALPVGRLRLRAEGSAGGHNGLKSLIAHLHSPAFPRLRVGVGTPRDSSVQRDFVLGPFSRVEQPLVEESVARAVDALELWLAEGIAPAMNRFNG